MLSDQKNGSHYRASEVIPPIVGVLKNKIERRGRQNKRQLLKQGLDWDWTGTGLELDWSNLANRCRLMQGRAYSDEI